MATRIATQQDIDKLRIPAMPEISPNGELVAFVLASADVNSQNKDIWIVSTEGGNPRQLTAGSGSNTMPRWSPDGQTLAFLSNREKTQRDVFGNDSQFETITTSKEFQVYLLPINGGEAVQLTNMKGGVRSPRNLHPLVWSYDGTQIAFLNTDQLTCDEKQLIEEKGDTIEFEQHSKYSHIYLVDVPTGEVRRVSPKTLQVWEFAWSPDNQYFAVVSSDLPLERSWHTSSRLVVFSLHDGSPTVLHESQRQVAMPAWSPDGKHVAFLSSNYSDRGAVDGGVFVVPSEGGSADELSNTHIASTRYLVWSDNGTRLLSTATEQGGMGIAEIEVDTGKRLSLWHGFATISDASTFDSTGSLFAITREDARTPKDIWLVKRIEDGLDWTQLTWCNPQTAEFAVGIEESVRWHSTDGLEIQGSLIKPLGTPDGTPYPLLVAPHSGPTGTQTASYGLDRWYNLVARGIAIFSPNFRGSVGFGLEFAEANIGDMGGMDWQDVNSGIDYLVDKGIADPERIGIAGGSYGGYMSAWAITQSTRFKAAVPRAGIYDWRALHGKSSISGWEIVHYGGTATCDVLDLWEKFSPINYVKHVKTPTLIIHGELDPICPVDGAYGFYRALKELGAKTELIIYPREGHGTKERKHALDQKRRSEQWIIDHLLA